MTLAEKMQDALDRDDYEAMRRLLHYMRLTNIGEYAEPGLKALCDKARDMLTIRLRRMLWNAETGKFEEPN